MTMTIDAVVIGTSTGGIETLLQLLPALERPSRAAYVVVIHLPRQRPSLLTEVFAPRCALPVVEAEDKAPVEAGTVYFAPPDYHLLLDQGPSLALSVDDPVLFSRPSIDVLFQSAADLYAERALGIVLTGASEDGARGLAAIAGAGGAAIVQDPAEAVAPTLPLAAIRLVPAARVLGVNQIKEVLQHAGR
jgi:two-component system chemotaxis response regulator CheB